MSSIKSAIEIKLNSIELKLLLCFMSRKNTTHHTQDNNCRVPNLGVTPWMSMMGQQDTLSGL